MRIMSYNIHHGVSADGKYTLDKIANLIYDLDISICLLQELDFSNERSKGVDQLSSLSEMTKLPHTAYGKNITYRKGFYGNGIISNFPLNRVKNKIFKAKNLTESQKVKVLTSFDKTTSIKEAKLVYETLLEGLKTPKPFVNESMLRNSASRATGIIDKKPILEVNNQFSRWQILAGIKKN